jgi:hypothetical protein
MRHPLQLMQRRLQQEQLQKQLVLVLVLEQQLVLVPGQQLVLVLGLARQLFSHRKRPEQQQQPELPKREICSFHYP